MCINWMEMSLGWIWDWWTINWRWCGIGYFIFEWDRLGSLIGDVRVGGIDMKVDWGGGVH